MSRSVSENGVFIIYVSAAIRFMVSIYLVYHTRAGVQKVLSEWKHASPMWSCRYRTAFSPTGRVYPYFDYLIYLV
ncbi:protein of unknown function (plasmid) [Cupriavidus taiwanensis]|uniref:Uncharacterized protein n=1 Tax=Cupriavidus taiwanensis TaxID=164546 RepID=A0A375EET9_9BURK|nr:protein of unknown function [Cupriavidus taiwanensis]SOZ72474.1 protein of unknown function [Cupriavidus taiwanensis]SOZ74899.1 protein of unknown function [Cupriavidus taiwanensis]SPA03340.1 protein of unknown function [Cupriavidus taiwanensis]SPA11704.1 protein of unknown function [Cupriavidus taiwanensis]